MPGWNFTRVQVDVNLHILSRLEGTFSLYWAQMTVLDDNVSSTQKTNYWV